MDPTTGRAGSSSALKLRQRRAARLLTVGVLVFFALNGLGFILIVLVPADFAGGLGGVLVGLLVALLWVTSNLLFPLIPVLVLAAFAYAIYHYHRRAPPALPSRLPAHRNGLAGDASRVTRVPVADVASELAMLEEIRTAAARRTRLRLWLLVPLGIGVAILLWLLPDRRGRDPGAFAFVILVAIGAIIGWAVAVMGPAERYARRYKEALVPRLLARYGAFTFSPAGTLDVGTLAEAGLLPVHDAPRCRDEIRGITRGRDVRINEVSLVRRGHKSDTTVFEGLLVTLSGEPEGPRILVRDRGGGIAGYEVAAPRGLAETRTGDPHFDEVYEVFAPDQASADHVLTPALRERLLTMSDGHAFSPPGLLGAEGRLVFSLHRWDSRDLLEPPALSTHDAAQQLASLERDLADIFGLVDAMIDVTALDGTLGSGRAV